MADLLSQPMKLFDVKAAARVLLLLLLALGLLLAVLSTLAGVAVRGGHPALLCLSISRCSC